MSELGFDRLLAIYRATRFDPRGEDGSLAIATGEVLTDLREIYTQPEIGKAAGIEPLSDPAKLRIGDEVRIRVGPPRLSIGRIVRSLDELLESRRARLKEPDTYFIIEGALDHSTTPVPDEITRYRTALEIVALFVKAAAYLDEIREELVFIHEGKFVTPVVYNVALLKRLSMSDADRLLGHFADDVHIDQKLAILSESICRLSAPRSAASRFTYLLDNLDEMEKEVRNGYKLFASSFSYAKIRGEIEAARVDYVSKIHKTLIDIQGQLLGIPVATVIVASQLKTAKSCGLEFWTNIAILGGAWIFVGLLAIAIVNQWVTLGSISQEIDGQRKRLEQDYAAIAAQFMDLFSKLGGRICWHRAALIGIGVVAIAGAAFATYVFLRITPVEISTCIAAAWL